MELNHISDFLSKDKKLCVIGLGYVGLPIALELARKFSVIGFDINPKRVELMRRGIDPSKELLTEDFRGADIYFTADINEIKAANFYIVAVPTPVDDHKVPDLTPLLKASETLGKVLKKGDYVVFESTVYPGCTEQDCVPVIEKVSGLRSVIDFKIGYSPERINPGDTSHTLTNVVKIVSGCDEESLELIAEIYASIIKPGVYKASSIKVAEAAKVIENTQRDLNIALMNELSQIFSRMGINTYEVIEAAATKWNFIRMYPGLVGGHCIGVDPYYLTYKSMELGYEPQIILSGRRINDGMSGYVAKKVVQYLLQHNNNIHDCRVLIMGATFKENVSDIRNSKVFDLYRELKDFSIEVDIVDPYANAEEVHEEYNVLLSEVPVKGYNAVIVAVNHTLYTQLEESYFESICAKDAVIIDIKNIFRHKIKNLSYWSL